MSLVSLVSLITDANTKGEPSTCLTCALRGAEGVEREATGCLRGVIVVLMREIE